MPISHGLARRRSDVSDSLRRHIPASPGLVAVLGAFLVLLAATLYPATATNQRMQAAAVLLGIVLVVAAAPTLRAAAWSAAALAAAWALIQLLLTATRGIDMPPPVAHAVGYAAYFGTSYVPVQA